jgi:hypothetical protein
VEQFNNGQVAGRKLIREASEFQHEVIMRETGIKEQVIVAARPDLAAGQYFGMLAEVTKSSLPW